ncbi:hypothetical protein H4K36_24545 [Streptomyces sp. DHE7-1]|nr:hypothetical protein [Streptomyces sp. DHE7-1]
MADIAARGPERRCDLRQTKTERSRSPGVRAVAQYRSHIAELGGFARARCASDAD